MAFINGSFQAPEIVAAPGGLFSVASVETHSDGDLRWATESYSQAHNGAWQTRVYRNGTGPGVELNWDIGPDKGTKVWPFEIVVKGEFHGINEINEDTIAGVRDYLEQVTEAAVEHELMYGSARTGGEAQILAGIDAANRATAPALDVASALAALEMPTGTTGLYTPMPRVIHLPADVATHMRSHLRPVDSDGRIYTRLGTPVVVGRGFENNDGPNNAAYTPASRWGYVTGALTVHLSEIFELEDALRQGFQPTTNRLTVVLNRTAAVAYDPTPEMAVKIDLTK